MLRGVLYVDLLWIDEAHRGGGAGATLLRLAEDEAKRRGARQARVNTFSFQAPGFYEKMGYGRLAVLEDHPPGHKTVYFDKKL